MFKDDFATDFPGEFGESLAENIGVLFDDAGKGDDKDRSTEAVPFCVKQGEEE